MGLFLWYYPQPGTALQKFSAAQEKRRGVSEWRNAATVYSSAASD